MTVSMISKKLSSKKWNKLFAKSVFRTIRTAATHKLVLYALVHCGWILPSSSVVVGPRHFTGPGQKF